MVSTGGVPHTFYQNSKKQSVSKKQREEELIRWVKYYRENSHIVTELLMVQYLYYDDINDQDRYNIETYRVNENFNCCDKCNKMFYIKGLYDTHKCG